MGLCIAFVSGGKDSYYAVYRYGLSVDLGVMLVYEFPRPSPHVINLGKSIETMLLAGIPVLVAKLTKGNEFNETASILRKLKASIIIAGDVYIEEHLRYMERLANDVGATLVEPLWGMDPEDLVYREFESGIQALVIGCTEGLGKWLGIELDAENIALFVDEAKKLNLDPLGERGEYHTLVVNGPLHPSRLKYHVLDRLSFSDYIVLRLG